MKLYLRDIVQVYMQALTTLIHEFYLQLTKELKEALEVQSDEILRLLQLLYGVPKSGNHWFGTYYKHYVETLSINVSIYNIYLLYRNEEPYWAIVGLQTDNTLILANKAFADLEESRLKFTAKKRQTLTVESPIKFNRGIISITANGDITVNTGTQYKNLTPVSISTITTTSSRGVVRSDLTTKEQYTSQRAKGAYIASLCQQEVAFDLSFAAQALEPDASNISALNKRIEWRKENAAKGLKYVELDENALKLVIFTDASFANNKDHSLQIGFVIALVDDSGKANIFHWSSIKCKRVTRSVLVSELYALVYGFDAGTTIKTTLDKIRSIPIPLIVCTDLKSLYDCLVKLGTIHKKRLMIDIMCLRQLYECREITEVRWVEGIKNPADVMTKSKPSAALRQLIDENYLDIEPMEWVER
jgi:hypothetical protein